MCLPLLNVMFCPSDAATVPMLLPCPSDAAAVPMLLLQLLQATSTIVFSYIRTTLWLLLLLRNSNGLL